MSDNILVALRLRPFISRELNSEDSCKYWEAQEKQIVQIDPSTKRQINSYIFDEVFDENITNNELYKNFAHPIVESALSGFNGTIFAYGQTSSGKTFTMSGNASSPGVIPLSIQNLFSLIENMPDREFLLRASYMEIYQENIYDLLTGSKITTIREDQQGTVLVPGLKEICVINEKTLLAVMSDGDKRRKVGETNMNERSSRSHSIFRLIIESKERGDKDCEGAITVSHLNLVDLAGSENVSQTGAVGERLKEGGAINKSLFMLGRVISQLSDGEQFINFRDSKLTRILQNSLGGNAKTVIICTVTPASKEQTLSTVRFASRAKSIKNKPVVNEVLSESALLKRYALEITKLKNALENERKTDKAQEVEQVKEKLDEQEKINLELSEKVKGLTEKLVVSSHPHVASHTKDLKKRRMTWAAPAFMKPPRRSIASFSSLKGLQEEMPLLNCPTINIEKAPNSDPKPNDCSITILEEEALAVSESFNATNLSTLSFEGNSEWKEELLNENDLSNIMEDSFLSPKAFAPRRRKKVTFLPGLCSRYIDVGCQTEEILNLSLSMSPMNVFVTPTKEMMSPNFGTPTGIPQTPRDILRTRIQSLREILESKEIALSEWQEELSDLQEFHRNELLEKINVYEEESELEKENVFLKKSLKDTEGLYLEANKRVSLQVQEIKTLKESVNLLEKERDDLRKESQDSQYYLKELQELRKELKGKKLLVEKLENEKLDFDMKMELALNKQRETETYLRSSLNDAWEELSEYEKCSFSQVRERKSKLDSMKQQLQVHLLEKEDLSKSLKSLQEELQLSKEEIKKISIENEEFSKEIHLLQNKNEVLEKCNAELSTEAQRFKEVNDTTMFTCEELSPMEQTCFMSASLLTNPSEVSRKLSETIQFLDESLNCVAIAPDTNLGEINGIKDQLCELKNMLMNQECLKGINMNNFFMPDSKLQFSDSRDEDVIKNNYLEEAQIIWLLQSICEDFIQYSSVKRINCSPSSSGTITDDEVQLTMKTSLIDETLSSSPNVKKSDKISDYTFCDETINLSIFNQSVHNGKDGPSIADELRMANMDYTLTESGTLNSSLIKNENIESFLHKSFEKGDDAIEQETIYDCHEYTKREESLLDLQKKIIDPLKEQIRVLQSREKELSREITEGTVLRKELENELNIRKKKENKLLNDLCEKEEDIKNGEFRLEKEENRYNKEISEIREKEKKLLEQIEELKHLQKKLETQEKVEELSKEKIDKLEEELLEKSEREKDLIDILREREKDLNNSNIKLGEMKEQYEKKISEMIEKEKELLQQIEELQRKQKDLENEANTLGKKDLNNSDIKFEEMKEQYEKKISEMIEKEEQLLQQIEELQRMQKDLKNEVNILGEKEDEVEAMITDFTIREELLEEKEKELDIKIKNFDRSLPENFKKRERDLMDKLGEKEEYLKNLEVKLEQQEEEYVAEISQWKNREEDLLKEVQDLNHKEKELENEINQLRKEKESIKSIISDLNEKEKKVSKKMEELEDCIKEKTKIIVDLESKLSECINELEAIKFSCNSYSSNQKERQTISSPNLSSSSISKDCIKTEIDRLMKEKEALNIDIETLQEMISSFELEAQIRDEELDNTKKELLSMKEKVNHLTSLHSLVNEKLESKEAVVDSLQKEIVNLKKISLENINKDDLKVKQYLHTENDVNMKFDEKLVNCLSQIEGEVPWLTTQENNKVKCYDLSSVDELDNNEQYLENLHKNLNEFLPDESQKVTSLSDNLMNVEKIITENEDQIKSHKETIDSPNIIGKENEKEIQLLKVKLNEYDKVLVAHNIKHINDLETELTQVNLLQIGNKEKDDENDLLKKKLIDYDQILKDLDNKQLSDLLNQLIAKNEENEYLNIKIIKMGEEMSDKIVTYKLNEEKLLNEIKQKEQTCIELSNKLEEFKKSISDLEYKDTSNYKILDKLNTILQSFNLQNIDEIEKALKQTLSHPKNLRGNESVYLSGDIYDASFSDEHKQHHYNTFNKSVETNKTLETITNNLNEVQGDIDDELVESILQTEIENKKSKVEFEASEPERERLIVTIHEDSVDKSQNDFENIKDFECQVKSAEKLQAKINEYTLKLRALEKVLDTKEKEIGSILEGKEEDKGRILLLVQENDKLKSELKEKNNEEHVSYLLAEIEKFKELNMKMSNQELELLKEVESKLKMCEEKDSEIKSLSDIIKDLKIEFEVKSKEHHLLSKKVEKLESILCSYDIQDMESVEKALVENNELKVKLSELRKECKLLNEEIASHVEKQDKIDELSVDIENLKSSYDIEVREKLNLLQEIEKRENIITENEDQIKSHREIIDSLNIFGKENEKEIQLLKVKLNEYDKVLVAHNIKHINDLETKLTQFTLLQIGNKEKDDENDLLKEKLSEYDQILTSYKLENANNLNTELMKIESLSQELIIKNEECKNLINEKKDYINNQERITLFEIEIKKLKREKENYYAKEKELLSEIKKHLLVLEENKKQIERLVETEKQLEKIERGNSSLSEKLKKLDLILITFEISDLEGLEKTLEQIKEMSNDLSVKNEECDALKHDIDILSSDQATLVEKLQENQIALQDYIEALLERDDTIKALEDDLDNLRRDHEGCTEKGVNNLLEIEKYVGIIEKYEFEMSEKEEINQKIMTENEELKNEVEKLHTKIKDYQKNEAMLKEENNCLKLEEKKTVEKLKILEKDFEDKDREYIKIKENYASMQHIGNEEKMIVESTSKIIELQKKNKDLNLIVEEMKQQLDEEKQKNKALDEELDNSVKYYKKIIEDFRVAFKSQKEENKTLNDMLKTREMFESSKGKTFHDSLTKDLEKTNSEMCHLKLENSESNSLNRILQKENEELKKKFEDLKIQWNTMQKTSITTPSNYLDSTNRSINKKSKQNLKDEIDTLQLKIYKLEDEINKLRRKDGMICSEEELQKQLDWMRNEMKQTEMLNKTLNKNCDTMEKDLTEMEKKNEELEERILKCEKTQPENDKCLVCSEKENEPANEEQNIHNKDIKSLKEEIFELKNENNVLKIQIQALKAPIEKEVQRYKEELKIEREKSKKIMAELRRVRNENCEASMIVSNSGHIDKDGPNQNEEQSHYGHGSAVILDLQVMRLKNSNYQLEKEKEKVENENRDLKEQVKFYKSKGSEWKTKCYKEEQKAKKLANKLQLDDKDKDKSTVSVNTSVSEGKTKTENQQENSSQENDYRSPVFIENNCSMSIPEEQPASLSKNSTDSHVLQKSSTIVNKSTKTVSSLGKENQAKNARKSNDSEECKVQ